ncbi:putative bifunctional diguanylate cyclase/phosphodiesterase [Sphingomonas quercus]|uniref:EAL domain-containing protein n=1 Tax=Sphingomonas quercus TaxID=2842451 RepID=A0ABS6BDL2_9SPHN|nr:bifunctional diguanylate cyclase/phosphodiesterase [Sphingomonas quercus]MBU3076412.1 EAL domain-containing protein [Sphingomonas quercus]
MIADAAPVFLLSFHRRDELAALTERCGWLAVGARRVAAAERRFVTSGATVAVVDARDAFAEGLAAMRCLADAVEANGAALLAILSETDLDRLGEVYAAGATHYLAEPFATCEYAQALRFAERLAERINGGHPTARRPKPAAIDALGWQWQQGAPRVRLSSALARAIGARTLEPRVTSIARRLGRQGLRSLRGALATLLDTGESTAFSHDGDGGRLVHRLRLDDDIVIARVEELDEAGGHVAAGSRDLLTGLQDAKAARRWLEAAIRAEGDGAGGVAVLLVSVSRFEIITAAFGVDVGDALLRIVARRIERLALRGRRMIARMAGAEFLVGLPAPVTAEEAGFLGRALADAVRRPFVAGEHVINLASHVGIAVAEPNDDAAALLRRASGALADAKTGEGGPVRLLSAPDVDAAVAQNQLEIDLRSALAQGEIELLYQPQIAVTTGQVVGVEALARWRHPRLGELGAETLFAAAERSDYLVQLSQHVQRQVVAEVTAWPAVLQRLRVAINVTAAEMLLPRFAEDFIAMIDAGGLDRRRVTVEVTEGGLIDDLNIAADLLAALRAGGLRVAIDDFGTGYSSLAYLKALPLDYLKIDKHLSQDIVGSPRDRVVVRGVIDMARSLGLAVIAEGVETAEQLSLLAQEGCNFYQGFLSAPPLDLPALEAMVRR